MFIVKQFNPQCHVSYNNRCDENVRKERRQPKATIPPYEIVLDFEPVQAQSKDEQHYNIVQTYEKAQTYERVETYKKIHHNAAQLSSEPILLCKKVSATVSEEKSDFKSTEVKAEPKYKVIETYEMVQIYERAQTYEIIDHDSDTQCLKQFLSGPPLHEESRETHSEVMSDFKPAQAPTNDKPNYEKVQMYERAQTYERIHLNDTQPIKQSLSGLTTACEKLSGIESEEVSSEIKN